jgi:protein ImuB
VWLRRLATDRITRLSSAPDETPLVVAQEVKSALRLSAVNDAAARLGLPVDMALADARARYPAIAVADADPDADRALLDAVADWCDRYTPLVGLEAPDGLILDITGCAHLFGGEAALGRDILHRLAAQGLHARAALADTVGCASAVARYADGLLHPPLQGEGRVAEGDPGWGKRDIFIIPFGETRPALLPLPLAALRLDADTVDALAQVGLKRIADVIDRPRAPLAARFGEHFVRRIDQALGREDEPITPRLPIPPYVAERRFAEPIALESDVLATIEGLAQELGRLLERRGEGARRLALALFRTDGKVHRLAVSAGAPLREGARIRSLFAERMAVLGDACDPGFGFDVIRLAVPAAERCDPVQTGLAGPDHAAELAHLIDRLGARFGPRRITRLIPQDTHIPEFAVAAVPEAEKRGWRNGSGRPRESGDPYAVSSQSGQGQRNNSSPGPRSSGHLRPSSRAMRTDDGGADHCIAQDSLAPIRPIRLFERPERIAATAEVPDGPPAQFTWRQVVHEVARVEGPERIAMEWWRDDRGRALTRDYFRVESKKGVRVWLYREGLFHETAQPSWFLHGLFA